MKLTRHLKYEKVSPPMKSWPAVNLDEIEDSLIMSYVFFVPQAFIFFFYSLVNSK